MAKKKFTTTRIVITILVLAVILYLVYVFSQRQKKSSEEGDWHNFNWGGSQHGGTEVLLCCTPNITDILQVGDMVQLDIGGCEKAFAQMIQDPSHICTTKTCVCRGDLTGVHEVVGFGDDSGTSFTNTGFRIQASWESSSSPTPSIVSGKFRKIGGNGDVKWF